MKFDCRKDYAAIPVALPVSVAPPYGFYGSGVPLQSTSFTTSYAAESTWGAGSTGPAASAPVFDGGYQKVV